MTMFIHLLQYPPLSSWSLFQAHAVAGDATEAGGSGGWEVKDGVLGHQSSPTVINNLTGPCFAFRHWVELLYESMYTAGCSTCNYATVTDKQATHGQTKTALSRWNTLDKRKSQSRGPTLFHTPGEKSPLPKAGRCPSPSRHFWCSLARSQRRFLDTLDGELGVFKTQNDHWQKKGSVKQQVSKSESIITP